MTPVQKVFLRSFTSLRRRFRARGIRALILQGVFARLFVIELIILAWCLAYYYLVVSSDLEQVWLFGKRVALLTTVVLAFVVISLGQFLQRRIIEPLEAIARANLEQGSKTVQPNIVPVPKSAPSEIRDIVASRTSMLRVIFKTSEERLQVIRYLRETFGRYYSDKILDEILTKSQKPRLGGRSETVSILMSDIRGFSSIAEDLAPQDLVKMLNAYFAHMSEIIIRYDGIVDEFQGDGILAFFRNGDDAGDHAKRAVACAIAMQNDLESLNKEVESEAGLPIRLGLAVNTGEVIVGNIGSEHRMKYGLVGSAVNVTARIESQTMGGEVMIGQMTKEILSEAITIDRQSSVAVKGFRSPLSIFSVTAINDDLINETLGRPEPSRWIEREFRFEAALIEEKTIAELGVSGRTVAISPDWIDAEMSGNEAAIYASFRLDFTRFKDCPLEHVYVKLAEKKQIDDREVVRMRITSARAEDRRYLVALVAGDGAVVTEEQPGELQAD